MEENQITQFTGDSIRKVWHKEQWYFSVLDIVGVLAETNNPTDYFKKIRKRDKELKEYVGTNCPQIAMIGKTGKKRRTIAGNTEDVLRVIQSIPSKKVEPFKQWLAKVGAERLEEIENPSLAIERGKEYYKQLGYNEDWIEKRLQSIDIRKQLTDEWKNREVKEGLEYAILTAEISKETFGLKPSEYKQLKGLKKENLRDHMTNLELIFTMLGEEQTKKEAVKQNAKGFHKNKKAAKDGGFAAGNALKSFEQTTKEKVVTDTNFKHQIKEAKKKKELDRGE